MAQDAAAEAAPLVALPAIDDGKVTPHPYTLIGTVRTFRVNSDGTFTPVVNITAVSRTYGVQFTFTIRASTFDADGAPPLTALRTTWVDTICAHDHVQGFHTEQDQGPDQILYNYAMIEVGTDDGSITDEVRVRMDQLNTPAAFGAIDAAWRRLVALGAS
jgi:hypothetical protein